MKQSILLVFILTGMLGKVQSQQRYTLKEAQEYAVQNSFNSQKAQLDIDQARAKILETIAIGLPQINAEGTYNNNIQIPTSVIPGEFFGAPAGTFIPVQFGVRNNLTGSITGTQLLFNGSYIVGLQASRAYAELISNQKIKTEIQVRQDVATAYFLAIAAAENVATLEKSTGTLKQLSTDTRALYENGLAEEQSADQLLINLTNLENNLENAKMQLSQALNLLKFQMGLPQSTGLELSESLDNLTAHHASELLVNNNDISASIDYKLSANNVKLQRLNTLNKKAAYLPTLSMFATHQQNAFFQRSEEFNSKSFYPATIVGFKLSVPLFSSGMKHQQVVQAKLDLDKAKISEVQAREGIALEQQNARNNYSFQLKNFDNQKNNLQLAEKVKQKTLIKFKEGIASSFELSQSESQYLQAQGGYIQAVINLLNAKVQFQKAFNQLN